MATAGLPTDKAVLAAIGTVALRHGQLDNSLKLLLRDLAEITTEQALDATGLQGSRELRERVRRIAKQRFGEGVALVKLDALLQQAKLASDERNILLHSVWGIEKGKPVIRDQKKQFQPAPSASQLLAVANKLADLIHEMHVARTNGFLADAMKKKPA